MISKMTPNKIWIKMTKFSLAASHRQKSRRHSRPAICRVFAVAYSNRIVATLYTHVVVDQTARRQRRQQAGQIRRAIGQRHQEAGEARRDVQMVDLEAGVDAAVEAHAHRQHGDGGHAIAAGVRGDDQTDGRTVLACERGDRKQIGEAVVCQWNSGYMGSNRISSAVCVCVCWLFRQKYD